MSFKKISDVDLEESASSALNVIVEDNGELKRVPWSYIFDAASGPLVIKITDELASQSSFADDVIILPEDELEKFAAARKSGLRVALIIEDGIATIDSDNVGLPSKFADAIGEIVRTTSPSVEGNNGIILTGCVNCILLHDNEAMSPYETSRNIYFMTQEDYEEWW